VERDGKNLLEWIRIHFLRGWPGPSSGSRGRQRHRSCATMPAFGYQPVTDRWASWYFTTSPTSWTNNDIAIQWLKTVFIPYTPLTAAHQWRVLILDGYKSHISRKFMELCIEHKIYIVFLCPHTSHICQPNDLGPYSHLKRAYKNSLAFTRTLLCENFPGRKEFLYAYYKARNDAFSQRKIQAGWSATGIWPRNRNKVL
jgi:hypothetical protein